MSESKASLRADRDHYKEWYEDTLNRYRESTVNHQKEINEIDKLYDKTVAFHRANYAYLAAALENVYGISVDTLLKANKYKLKQGEAAELMNAYTEAISAEPAVSSKSKGKN